MSFAAEPYSQFVDDLVSALTGGTIRESFRFLPEQASYRLSASEPVVPATVRIFGLAGGAYQRFQRGRDFVLGPDNTFIWQAAGSGRTSAPRSLPIMRRSRTSSRFRG